MQGMSLTYRALRVYAGALSLSLSLSRYPALSLSLSLSCSLSLCVALSLSLTCNAFARPVKLYQRLWEALGGEFELGGSGPRCCLDGGVHCVWCATHTMCVVCGRDGSNPPFSRAVAAETRNAKPGTRNPKPETRTKPTTESQKCSAGSRRQRSGCQPRRGCMLLFIFIYSLYRS